MRLARILSLVVLVGFCAAIARADATDTSSIATNDPVFKFNDPTCTAGPDCLVFTYYGPTGFVPILTFLTPSPDPIPVTVPPTTYSCSSNVFLLCEVLDNGFFCPLNDFCGVSFQLGFITNGETVDLESNDPLPALIIPAVLTPEPTTGVLFGTGLLLVFLGTFAKKRFRVNFLT